MDPMKSSSDLSYHPFCHIERPSQGGGEIRFVWAMILLVWMTAGFGVYFGKMLILPGRIEHLLQAFQALLG